MDKSVDSIGSCSLDVDADSTDFSDTSGSLNLATPSSAKDITKEFTSRIKERCQISQINCQQATTILDPISGKITTIITATTPSAKSSPTSSSGTLDASPIKKPSYLNLACCVNGYSNLTTYDSKLRQNINKSREVSPIRPSSATTTAASNSLQHFTTFGNFLTLPHSQPQPIVPMPVYCNNNYTTKNNNSTFSIKNQSLLSSSNKGNMTDTKTTTATVLARQASHERSGSIDMPDNCNGTTTHFKQIKYYNSSISPSITSATTATTKTASNNHQQRQTIFENESILNLAAETTKSFIQQRVERLYGPGALAQGFYSPKKTKSLAIKSSVEYDNMATTASTTNTILCEHLKNAQNQHYNSSQQQNHYMIHNRQNYINNKEYDYQYHHHHYHNFKNGINSSANNGIHYDNPDYNHDYDELKSDCDDLPVLRHLRPEFRAQLSVMSPKRTIQQQQQQQQQLQQQQQIHKALNKHISNVTITNNNNDDISNSRDVLTKKITTLDSDALLTNGTTKKFNVDYTMTRTQVQTQAQIPFDQIHKDVHENQLNTQNKNCNSFNSVSEKLENDQSKLLNLEQQSTSKNLSSMSNIICCNDDNNDMTLRRNDKITDDQNCIKHQKTSIDKLKEKEHNKDKDNYQIQNLEKLSNSDIIIKKDDKIPNIMDNKLQQTGKMLNENKTDITEINLNTDKTTVSNAIVIDTDKCPISEENNGQIFKRDGYYFLNLLKTEQNRLLGLADEVEKDIELLSSANSNVSDDVVGYLRSASGKAKLLVSQKMKQFEGLCNNNLNQRPDEKFPTTVEDLQGFWDMVMLQVNNVDTLFKEIEDLKANGWKKPIEKDGSHLPPPSGSKLIRRPIQKHMLNINSNTSVGESGERQDSSTATSSKTTTNGASITKKSSTSALAAAKKREAQRKQLMELKRKSKQQQNATNSDSVEIYVNDNNHQQHCQKS